MLEHIRVCRFIFPLELVDAIKVRMERVLTRLLLYSALVPYICIAESIAYCISISSR
jgi:hypothetical protein